MLLWVMGVGFENTCTVYKGSEMSPELFQDFICMSIKKLKDTLM